MDGCEIAVHLAAVASVQPSLANPLHTNRVNVGGTLNVLDAARRASVHRVVFASSCAFYGHHAAFPLGEDLPPQPLSPYAAAKAAGEMYCAAFHASYGLPTVSLRFFNI
jgi:UDP-glucose 4-epimerase